jgi:hypothetical protein
MSPAVSNPIVIAPTVTGKIDYIQKYNKKHKKVGKPVFSGFEFDFSTAMNVSSVTNKTNYTLSANTTVTKKVGKKKTKITQLNPLGFSLTSYSSATNSVMLVPVGKQSFPKGGQIVLSANSPQGIRSVYGVLLDGNDVNRPGTSATFLITAKEKGLTHSLTPILPVIVLLQATGRK